MKNQVIKIKVNPTKIPNKMHFETQLSTRSHVFKPKKGKGSFKRKERIPQKHDE